MNEQTNNPPVVTDTVHKGAILKRIREERGLSVEVVHEATKIPMDSLRAIEEGYTVRTLSEFYYRSFVKIYANYLEIDINSVLDVKKEQLPRYIKKSPGFEIGLVDKIQKLMTKQRKRQLFYALCVLLGFFLFFKMITFMMTRKPAPAKVRVVQEAAPEEFVEDISPAEVIPAETEVPVAAVAEVAVESAAPPQLPLKEVMLTVRAKKTSWLRVKADGNVVFQSNLGAGDAETWSADERIEITGRNISDLEFELNGKLIGSLGRSSRDAKGLIVTSEGLSVTK